MKTEITVYASERIVLWCYYIQIKKKPMYLLIKQFTKHYIIYKKKLYLRFKSGKNNKIINKKSETQDSHGWL